MMTGKHLTSADQLKSAQRLVIKVGSAILCGADGVLNETWLSSLANDIAALRQQKRDVVVVTSGAIALGKSRLGVNRRLRLDEKQAASAAGQAVLTEAWQQAFMRHEIVVAQLLLTLDDTENRRRYLNARATFRALLDLRALPLVNENDTVATSEIRYGDNDRLAAHAAQLTESDTLVILSDVDGLYTADPNRDNNAVHIPLVDELTSRIEQAASGPNVGVGVGSGGMKSKIEAAIIAGASGCATIIAPGSGNNPLTSILNGNKATLINPSSSRHRARHKWIGGRLKQAGQVSIDDGAEKALQSGASLLPAGIIAVSGEFNRGDTIGVTNVAGGILGQGLSAFSSEEVKKIVGCRSEELEKILGYQRRPAVIEKDDLVLKTERTSE